MIYKKILDTLNSNKKGALLTVIETQGSTPRKAGTKMFVSEDGETFGTIGGGDFESTLIKLAIDFINRKKSKVRNASQIKDSWDKHMRSLQHSENVLIEEFDFSSIDKNKIDMHCGGKMKVLIEPIIPSPKAIIFGGGHISIVLAKILKLLEFNVTVTDDRRKYANKKRFPDINEIIAGDYNKQFSKLKINDNTYLIIVTRAHSQDEICLFHSLKTNARYIGMIGSKNKFEIIKTNLLKRGFRKKDLERIHCPIGIDIGAQTPEEIAISITAEIIKEKYQIF